MSQTAAQGPQAHPEHKTPEPPARLEPTSAAAPRWTELIGAQEWELYRSAIQQAHRGGLRFMLGGAFGLATYTGRWRNTKDLDLFIVPADRDLGVRLLTELGFDDYYPTLPYDRGWIYRATRSGMIVDLIWSTPNRRSRVEESWFEHARELLLRSEYVKVLPAEELAWIKLYVLQRDRCDWPDIINLLYSTSATLNWERLAQRLGDDLPLLLGLLSVFAWVCPDRLQHIPAALRKRAGIAKQPETPAGPNLQRVRLLDSRPWFASQQPEDAPMQL